MHVFLEFSAIIIFATVLSIGMRLLRQPLVIGYILAGILISPSVLNLVNTKDYIELFSTIGITILLFIVGLNLSPKVIREVGKISFIGGIAQIVLTTFVGSIVCLVLGISWQSSLALSLAISFSSTIIILKILSDKNELQKLYGKITVGFLLVQDLVAIGALMFVASLTQTSTISYEFMFLLIIAKLMILVSVFGFVTMYVLPGCIRFFAASQELLFLFSISWGLGLASIFYLVGFSVEVGALVAGVSLAITPYADGIASRLKPLRDFFIVLFFVLLGSQMVFSTIQQILLPAIIISLFVLIIKPLIVFYLMNLLGYKTKPAFQTAISLAQISEFSLIFMTLFVSNNHSSVDLVSLVTLIALITIAGSSYLLMYSDELYKIFQIVLKKIEIRKHNHTGQTEHADHDLFLFGYDRVGSNFIEAFAKLDKKYVVIDFNPELINHMQDENIPFKYGDVEDVEFLHELHLAGMKMCVSTIPYFKVNALLVKRVRAVNQKAIIIVRAREIEEARQLYDLGASYVIMPYHLGAQYASRMIAKIGIDPKKFKEEREKHLAHVKKY